MDPGDFGDPILDPLLHKILSSERPRRLVYWISVISAKPKKLRRKIEASLFAKNVLIREDDRFLGVAQVNQGDNSYSVKYQLKTSLRAGILAGQAIDLHSLALLGLLRSARLLQLVFTADELRVARRRIQEAIVREALENQSAQMIEEIDAAVFACLTDE